MVTLTQKKPEINVDIRPRLVQSGVVYAPFDIAKETLEENGYRIISLEENAEQRIIQGKDSYISNNGNRVSEGVIYIPKKGNFLVRRSPILSRPKEVTDCHRNNKEFYPSKEEIEQSLNDSVDFPISYTEISTKKFNKEALTIWAFGNGDNRKAQKYGDFLLNAGIKSMPVYPVEKNYADNQNSPFARQLWFGGLGGRSVLDGGRGLDDASGLRGVLYLDAEGVAPKN